MPDARHSFTLETRLLRWGESSTAGRTITLELSAEDGEHHPFKGIAKNTRFQMTFRPIFDDETLAPEPERVPAPPRDPESIRPPAKSEKAKAAYQDLDEMAKARTRAGILCTEPEFAKWIGRARRDTWRQALNSPGASYVTAAAACLREALGVASRSEIGTDERAFLAFKKIEDAYQIESKYGENLR